MANPNLLGSSTISGQSVTLNLSSTSETTVLNNPAGSNQVFKIEVFRVTNSNSTSRNITLKYYPEDDRGGTAVILLSALPVFLGSPANIFQHQGYFYLPEDKSLSIQAANANMISVFISYEVIG